MAIRYGASVNVAEYLRETVALIRADASDEPFMLRVADWLHNVAYWLSCDNCNLSRDLCVAARQCGKRGCCPECAHGNKALAVARAYRGDA